MSFKIEIAMVIIGILGIIQLWKEGNGTTIAAVISALMLLAGVEIGQRTASKN